MVKHLPGKPVLNGEKTVENGCDTHGRFVVGAAPGPGRPKNPYARRHAAMRRAMLKELHARDVRAIVRKIITQAREGNWTAIRVLFEWVLGAPPPAVDPDRVDEHEADVRRRSPTIFERMVLGLDREDMGSPRWGPAADEPPPEPPDPRSGWELFAEERLEWGSGWAAPLDLLLLSYARWCAGYGRLLLPEGDVVQWLTGRGAVAIGVNGDRRLQGLRILD